MRCGTEGQGAISALYNLSPGAHIHLVGIGGIGLSAIARLLLDRGYAVSGSDLHHSPITHDLERRRATVYEGHREQNVSGTDALIVSSAIPEDNPEVVAAKRAGIPVFRRGQALAWLMKDRCGIAVAGTHGKTTVSAMIGLILRDASLDPTIIVGGIVPELGSNAREGNGPHFVIEADEYDRTFLELSPQVVVVTSIEMDHPDCYTDLEDMTQAFVRFLQGVPAYGFVMACGDDPQVREALRQTEVGIVSTYGLGSEVQWRATDIRQNTLGGSDFLVTAGEEQRGRFELRIPGIHNVCNALAAIGIADHLGLDLALARDTLERFRGVGRRFEVKGEWQGITVVDDYAHHPSEIKATLTGARQRYDGRRIWVVFQPHTYSRTKALLTEFASAFDDADQVIVTPIYAAREQDTFDIEASDLVGAMNHTSVTQLSDLSEVAAWLAHWLTPGDVLITMGAGDVWRVGEELLAMPHGRPHRVSDRPGLTQLARQRGLGDRLLPDEPLSKHTSFQIGGRADYFTVAENEEQLRSWVMLAREVDQAVLLLGRGTNVLVADAGYRGLVIENRCCGYDLDAASYSVVAKAGLPLARLAREAAQSGLGGLEWAIGIPGTLGGAIVNNAGAYGGEMATVVRRVRVLDHEGKQRELATEELGLGYRTSRFRNTQGNGEIVLSVALQLEPESAARLKERMDQYRAQRRAVQPLQPSAGSVFKNPPDRSAAQLIDEAGLRGKRVGGAQISEKHANYIVNLGQATAADVLLLVTMAQDEVWRRCSLDLELEIELVGEFEGSRDS